MIQLLSKVEKELAFRVAEERTDARERKVLKHGLKLMGYVL
jgi:hypothetical protein